VKLKVDVNSKKLEKDLQDAFKKAQSKENMSAFGDYVAERIMVRTRLGRGVAQEGGASQPLKPLSDSYKKQRQGKIAFFTTKEGVVVPYVPDQKPKLSEFTRPTKSNLTFTGQMLESIKTLSAKVGEVVVGLSGNRKDGLTNLEVGQYVSKARPFMNLSKPEKEGLAREIRKLIQKILKSS